MDFELWSQQKETSPKTSRSESDHINTNRSLSIQPEEKTVLEPQATSQHHLHILAHNKDSSSLNTHAAETCVKELSTKRQSAKEGLDSRSQPWHTSQIWDAAVNETIGTAFQATLAKASNHPEPDDSRFSQNWRVPASQDVSTANRSSHAAKLALKLEDIAESDVSSALFDQSENQLTPVRVSSSAYEDFTQSDSGDIKQHKVSILGEDQSFDNRPAVSEGLKNAHVVVESEMIRSLKQAADIEPKVCTADKRYIESSSMTRDELCSSPEVSSTITKNRISSTQSVPQGEVRGLVDIGLSQLKARELNGSTDQHRPSAGESIRDSPLKEEDFRSVNKYGPKEEQGNFTQSAALTSSSHTAKDDKILFLKTSLRMANQKLVATSCPLYAL